MKDYYQILGLKRSASRAEIRKRWLELALKLHPDHNPDDPGAQRHFMEVREAYTVLYDDSRRSMYDRHGVTDFTAYQSPPAPSDYFYCKVSPSTTRLNDEVEVSFTYSHEGRIFKRPEFKDFHITGPPYVKTRTVSSEGLPVKETTLTYIVCPLRQGRILIGPATIKIGGKVFRSDPQPLAVMAARCYYMRDMAAGNYPYRYALHFEQAATGKSGRKAWRLLNHVVLVPRSNAARAFHTLGSGIKIVSTVAGIVYLSPYAGFWFAAIAGNVAGFLNCRLLYRLAGVQPKFGHSETFGVISEYEDRGYLHGTDLGIPLLKSHWLYRLGRAVV